MIPSRPDKVKKRICNIYTDNITVQAMLLRYTRHGRNVVVTFSSSSCVNPSRPPMTRTTSARLFSGVLKYPISMFFTRDLREEKFSNSLITHHVKRKKIITVTVVWIPIFPFTL